ncbi:glycoside hydrolase/deacetylase [Neoconidiobolus thromboides FSU 785]|nr:glycoside hydrolase/deacetylase [Neoconidiobolus thromboides FSU 785]
MNFLFLFALVVFILSICTISEEIKCNQSNCDLPPIFNCKTPGHFALTFDDGPTEYTDEILNILKEHRVIATFFVLGVQLEKNELKSKLVRTFEEGHTIASHSYSHPKFLERNDQQIVEEIKKTENLIFDIIGKRPAFFRFPYLSMDQRVQRIVASLGYQNIHVSVDSFDWREKSGNSDMIRWNIINGVKNSDPTKNSFISLQHETTLPRLAKLPDIIRFIREKKYKFVNMETCLGVSSGYQIDKLKLKNDEKKDNINNNIKSNTNATSIDTSSSILSSTLSSRPLGKNNNSSSNGNNAAVISNVTGSVGTFNKYSLSIGLDVIGAGTSFNNYNNAESYHQFINKSSILKLFQK